MATGEPVPPGKPMSMEQHMLNKGEGMMQTMKPIKEMNQHACTFALYGHDLRRQLETHHFVTRINEDFLQCAVYDTDDSNARIIVTVFISKAHKKYLEQIADEFMTLHPIGKFFHFETAILLETFLKRQQAHFQPTSGIIDSTQLIKNPLVLQLLNFVSTDEVCYHYQQRPCSFIVRTIGVEYIVSERYFDTFPHDEQKLWHTHAYEIKSGLWMNPRVPEMGVKAELENLVKTYGKFWCTWQVDRGEFNGYTAKLIKHISTSLMMSPQPMNLGQVKPELLERRDNKYSIHSEALKTVRVGIREPDRINNQADYWKHLGKCFSIAIEPMEMKKVTPFP